MKYMGSKTRIAKDIIPIMLANRTAGQWWVEPFVGGGNIIDKVGGNRLGADINPWVIDALVDIRDHLDDLPRNNSEFTESDYLQLRKGDEYRYKGYAGFALSYGGKWLGGWCRDGANKRDYVREAYNNAVQQSKLLQGVILLNKSYANLDIPTNSIIYCDPPYFGTTKYASEFDHAAFWQWCRDQSRSGHTVFISEYVAPDDFKCIWSREICSSLTRNTGSKVGVERLFQYDMSHNR